MFRAFPGATIQKNHRYPQATSEIPPLLAANLERGGNGIASDGTHLGTPMQVAATHEEETADKLGEICGREGRAGGCNWTFSPAVDVDLNLQNPLVDCPFFAPQSTDAMTLLDLFTPLTGIFREPNRSEATHRGEPYD